eukprot:TRINITY_DN3582_c0_g2_i1.p1 TRINITY_DN3582_c0_g2~~TRINITY_DN3582_c0_g2_i1.p1  ORF type:complete len:277 (+),score=59.56 TRINITY_DN3582_c0_g2_i1:69-833(+)
MAAELAVYVRHRGDLVPIQVSADATAEDLYGAVRQAVDMRRLVLSYQGDDLPSDATPLADTGLSAEAVLEMRAASFEWSRATCGHCVECEDRVVRDTYMRDGAGQFTGFWRYTSAGPPASTGQHTWRLVWSKSAGVHPEHAVMGLGMDADKLELKVRSAEERVPECRKAVLLWMFSGELCTVSYPDPNIESNGTHHEFDVREGTELTVQVSLDTAPRTATFTVGEDSCCVEIPPEGSVSPLVGFYEGECEVTLV